MLALPRSSVDLRRVERNPTFSKVATGFPFTSRKWKLPFVRFTRRTSGVNGFSITSPVLGPSTGTLDAGGLVARPVAVEGGPAAGGGAGSSGGVSCFAYSGMEGRRHWPSLFWAQTT